MVNDDASAWPRDLKIFALLVSVWGAGLIARVVTHALMFYSVVDLQAVIGGIKFFGDDAKYVLVGQALMFEAIGIGIFAERRWGLVLALAYLTQVVISHLVFIIAYMPNPTEAGHVRLAALEGPVTVAILLYVWVRSRTILLDET